ncbi:MULTISPECIES: orotidine-5'-phosphate decarboxylase [Clostridium]|uniref:Orotidine 5'-phosphate decarboxylase n=1 Tax=Clostridium faecium TaxID=2762223 RepID=A0ABR8YWD2_9CLOT|nr:MULTISPECIES: orotidine-5'-phosphate decarboxylase [Clostridium]MBD8048587.1 orotidine-5'-phosphate decarboxylase [Clostridium faecium]MDU1348592.1 orotidine-5'-phosphate decarboxylase [Clostridium argentinense]
MIIDKLFKTVKEKGHVCVGLDTDLSYIPNTFLEKFSSLEDAIFEFNKAIIDETIDVAACYKPQIAYYEALGIKGLMAYKRTLEYIRFKGGISIGDIKRGDISKTAEMYAKAHFEGDFEADFITLNPYMGLDSIEPYLPYIKEKEKGVFLLVRTSNKGAKDIQYIDTLDGKKVFNLVGEKIQDLGKECMGECGYSSIGGVVGCTHVEEGVELRNKLNSMFFLIPGYGAQGGKAEDVALYLKDGNGGVVNSSRGIMLAYKKHEDGEANFAKYARKEVIRMRDEILRAIRQE